jgi:hypothetical protein
VGRPSACWRVTAKTRNGGHIERLAVARIRHSARPVFTTRTTSPPTRNATRPARDTACAATCTGAVLDVWPDAQAVALQERVRAAIRTTRGDAALQHVGGRLHMSLGYSYDSASSDSLNSRLRGDHTAPVAAARGHPASAERPFRDRPGHWHLEVELRTTRRNPPRRLTADHRAGPLVVEAPKAPSRPCGTGSSSPSVSAIS